MDGLDGLIIIIIITGIIIISLRLQSALVVIIIKDFSTKILAAIGSSSWTFWK
jgi:hypothetical protein